VVEKVILYRMLVGGFRDGKWKGAHRHNGLKIRYLADEKRATITEIEVARPDGSTDVDYFQHEPGCFRCHDKNHEKAKGEVVQKKCSGACHDIIATEEEKPEAMEVLYP
jgi:hypothetical protein